MPYWFEVYLSVAVLIFAWAGATLALRETARDFANLFATRQRGSARSTQDSMTYRMAGALHF